MGALRKTMDYLGLSEPQENEEFSDELESTVPDAEVPTPRPRIVEPALRFPHAVSSQPEVASELKRIVTIRPTTYNEAQNIGEAFKDGTPVIMNLGAMNDLEARRMIDFAAGLSFALDGGIEKVTNRVFLLSPKSVQVDEGESSLGSKRDFFNQS